MADLTRDEFFGLFSAFEHTAYRLEVRESYAGVDDAAFRDYQAGKVPSLADYEPWLENVRAQTAAGKRVERVRVVSEPWSGYTRFGLWACQSTVGAGEDIRYLVRDRAASLDLPACDYWLFDSRLPVVIHFDDAANDMVRWEAVGDPAAVVQHNYWRDVAWHHAIRRDDYVARAGQGGVEPPAGP